MKINFCVLIKYLLAIFKKSKNTDKTSVLVVYNFGRFGITNYLQILIK